MSGCRVLIVDDSALVRRLLSSVLAADPAIEVVGTASDPYIAREKIKQLRPDVITLDVEMPRMDGLTFLSNLMRLRPMPVVMISSLTSDGAETTLKALELGAVDFVTKPRLESTDNLDAYADELRAKVRAAARARLRGRQGSATSRDQLFLAPSPSLTNRVIAIGASTGGTEAIRDVLSRLPPNCPPVVVVQHIPAAFSRSFAARLNQHSALVVCESQGNESLQAGHAYLAPGDRHLRIVRSGHQYITRLDDSAPVNRHKPSVDVLFESVAACAGKKGVGILLTGMGRDGAKGLLRMRAAGAITLAQDESSCVVFGMPHEAISIGAADQVVALNAIAERALERLAAADNVSIRTGNG